MKLIKKILFVIALLGVTGGSYYWWQRTHDEQGSIQSKLDIRLFDAARDTQFIKQQNFDNWYLLHNTPDYDLDFMLEKSSPYTWDVSTYGRLTTVVLFDGDKHVGFVNYYLRGLHEGTVFLLSVDTAKRGKGYGEALLRYAVEELKKQGARYIKLSVREENEPAQKLYRKLGFKIESSDHGFHFYRLDV